MAETKLFYIGDHFYSGSRTIMSSIYEEGTGARYDWGFVNRDLREGKTVTIRQATPEEYNRAIDRLQELQRQERLFNEARGRTVNAQFPVSKESGK
jgi:hypothetical protein